MAQNAKTVKQITQKVLEILFLFVDFFGGTTKLIIENHNYRSEI